MLLHLIAPIVAMFAAIFVSPEDADALVRTAPAYLTHDTAISHIASARAASWLTHTQSPMLLSIGHHESRYTRDVVTPEPGNRTSCGVMTPEPLRDRQQCLLATETLAQGYLAGARHLHQWLIACRGNETCAVRGYAGCGARQPCQAADQFWWRARWIADEIARRRRHTSRVGT
jgi:hypothetical protein